MKKHLNIAIFIPHRGCKNDCVFCNQKIITGTENRVTVDDVKNIIEKYIGTLVGAELVSARNKGQTQGLPLRKPALTNIEIAFFGGSFTGLDICEMTSFLKVANEYIDGGNISGIRISTRPDYITDEILDILERYNVKAIELGVQSMFDDVLLVSKRGHTVEDTIKACEMINERKIALTGQMMLGLPESDREKDIDTACKLVKLKIESARIYPTIVFNDTKLYEMYQAGKYKVIDIDEAVYRAKEIKKIFDKNKIKILRMGLCASDNMGDESLFTGPYHPAFGELVESEIIFDDLCEKIEELIKNENNINIEITAKKNIISKVAGHKRRNIIRLKEKFKIDNIKVAEKESLWDYSINLNRD